MNEADALRLTLNALDSAGVPNMLTGGFLVAYYSFPRFTKDADIVIEMLPDAFSDFARRLPPGFDLDRQISFETITGSKRHILDVAAARFRIELFVLGEDAHHRERFARRRRQFLPMPGCETWISTAEDLIIQKLRWFRAKDQDDLRAVLLLQGDALDFAHIHRWCDAHGTRSRLEEIQRSIPPI